MAGLIEVGGLLYGTTLERGSTRWPSECGVVFSIDPAAGAEKTVYQFQGGADGERPAGSLIAVAGTLYGTTYQGGQHDRGTVFSLDPATKVKTTLYVFHGLAKGVGPLAALLSDSGRLWGTTVKGGRSPACDNEGCGTIFSIAP